MSRRINGVTERVINWVWSRPGLADHLRGVMERYPDKREPHACIRNWILDLVIPEFRKYAEGWPRLVAQDPDLERTADELFNWVAYEWPGSGLTEMRRTEWVTEIDGHQVLAALGIGNGAAGSDVYAHVTKRPFAPKNRYRVRDAETVYEGGWTSAAGCWGVLERDRQVCPRPDRNNCGCKVVQS